MFRGQVLDQLAALRIDIQALTNAVNKVLISTRCNNGKMEEVMADLKQAVTAMADKITAQTTVIGGMKVFIEELKAQLAAAAGSLDAKGESELADQLNSLAASLTENTDTIAMAVAKNTDAGDEVHAAQM
jgi:small-conductance mechanosensitive channel